MPADRIPKSSTWLRSYLFPGAAERDPAFRAELERLSRIALYVIGGVQIGVSVFMVLARMVVLDNSNLTFRASQGAAIIALGVLSLACARLRRLEPWARTICAISGLLTAAVLIWSSLFATTELTNPDDFIPGQITLVMLVGITVVPLRPMHTLWMGAGIGAIYVVSADVATRYLRAGPGPDANYILFIFMLTLLCTGMTAVVYRQRVANFELRQEQVRALLAENASSLARLAAALSHELNNPMGALLSGVDTMLLLASKQATSSPQEQGRLVLLQADLRKSIQQSAQRLKSLVSRMQRFTNLDQAEVQNANLNELLTDVASLMESQMPQSTKLALQLEPVEPVMCRPQQISAVFSNLVTNAIRALDGSERGEVTIATRQVNGTVEVEVRDTGRGVEASRLEDIFDPGFKAAGSRVRATNWSMFSSRQIIREHGGDIQIRSGEGKGTTVVVTLPVADGGVT